MKALLVFGIIGCVCAGMFTGCSSSGAQQISPSNPLIIDESPGPGEAPPPAATGLEPEPSISFQITNIYQDYYEDIDEWRTFVRFDYEVRNTGSVDIRYYEVAFIAECVGGQKFSKWTNGEYLMVGATNTEEFLINVGGLEVIDIIVNDWGFGPDSVSHEETEPELEVSAKFRIKSWQQDYDDYYEEWSDYVYVYFEVENTGDVDIDYYKVYFIAECKGGKEYYDWTNGSDVGVGDKVTDDTMIDVNGREVTDVDFDDWVLNPY